MNPIMATAMPNTIGVIIPPVFPRKRVIIVNIKRSHSNSEGIFISYLVIICGMNMRIRRNIFVDARCQR